MSNDNPFEVWWWRLWFGTGVGVLAMDWWDLCYISMLMTTVINIGSMVFKIIKALQCIHWNCRSMFGQSCTNPVQQLHWSGSISDSMVNVLFIYDEDCLNTKQIETKSFCEKKDIEVITIILLLVNMREIYIMTIYRPLAGYVSSFITECEDICMRVNAKPVLKPIL